MRSLSLLLLDKNTQEVNTHGLVGGLFMQISGYEAKFQIKIAYDGTEILKRVKKNIGDKEWTQWSAL